jgi:hypothetical protein
MNKIKRTDSEIDNLLNSANAWEEHGGSSVPGMSYEQGVKAGIEWLLGNSNEYPIEEEPAG